MNITTKHANIAAAIAAFAADLSNSIDMQDRKAAVGYLSLKVGAEKANQIAAVFGLTDSYYQA